MIQLFLHKNKWTFFWLKCSSNKRAKHQRFSAQARVLQKLGYFSSPQVSRVILILMRSCLSRAVGFNSHHGAESFANSWLAALALDLNSICVRARLLLKECHHPVGSFIILAHATSLTCKENVQSTNTSHPRIDIVYTNHERKGRF